MKKVGKTPEVFCPVPFASIILNPNGHVGSCRELGIGHVLGNISDNTIEEIWNNKKFREWRKEFLTGNIVTCKDYIKNSSCNKLHSNQSLLPHIVASEVVTTPILRLSPDINGLCNLRCPFCNIWDMPNGQYDRVNGFWKSLEKDIIPGLIQIDPLAGEPFIQKDLYKIIKMAAASNPALSWNFTTNAQWTLSESIKDHLRKIQINLISVSLDTVDAKTYEVIRVPGKLQSALATIQELQLFQKEKGFNLEINFSIQKENVYQLMDMIRFCKKYELYPFIQYVYTPRELSPSALPEEEKIKILTFYFSNMKEEELLISHRFLRAIIDTLPAKLRQKYMDALSFFTGGKFKKLVSDAKAPESVVP